MTDTTRDDALLLAEAACHLLDHLQMDAPTFLCRDIPTVRHFAMRIRDDRDAVVVAGYVCGWPIDDTRAIDLLTPKQLATLPRGTVVTTLDGDTAVVGRDPIDDDTRAGFTAWGTPCPTGDRTVHRHDLEASR